MAEYLFNEPRYNDPEAAREHLESVRWPNGPVCPHCGATDRQHAIQGGRAGLYECGHCRDQFTVTVGTVFERSKISLDKWLLAASLMAASKKGISSKQIERMLGVTYKTAWFMTHRLREAMKQSGGMFSTGGNTVEADSTYVGGKEKNKHANKRTKGNIGGMGKTMVFSLIERETGRVRSTTSLLSVNAATLKPYIQQQLCPTTRLITDSERPLRAVAPLVASHETVNHSAGEYVRGDVHSNTVEGFFSVLKRGIVGTFHHVSPQHLQKYVTEFDFRYNHRETTVKIDGKNVKVGFSDAQRTDALLKGISGKRLTYKRVDAAA